MCLDVLRALARSPRSLEVFLDEVALAQGANRDLDGHVEGLSRSLSSPGDLQARARRIVEDMALALQGSLLVRFAPAAVSDAFCAARLGGRGGHEYGTLPGESDFEAIIERARIPV